MTNIKAGVREYYGKTLRTSADLKSNACCSASDQPASVRGALANIHPEVLAKYYGCGLTIPRELGGLSVLDLGSGSGRDCYALAQLVGPAGRVVGVDMTDEQLAVADRHQEFHRLAFGYEHSNVEFRKGDIERLDAAGLGDSSFDLIVSNCVINLAQDKSAALSEAWRVLKEGGELYFSDVYADRRIPAALQADPVLYGECLAGALYWNDFLRLAKKAGFADPRLVESRPLELSGKEIRRKIGHVSFFSATYRLFKLPALESACEDYGQTVIYNGTLKECAQYFDLDDHHRFPAGKVSAVCGNTFAMLAATRFKRHFEFLGSMKTHCGIFKDCGVNLPFKVEGAGGGCC